MRWNLKIKKKIVWKYFSFIRIGVSKLFDKASACCYNIMEYILWIVFQIEFSLELKKKKTNLKSKTFHIPADIPGNKNNFLN